MYTETFASLSNSRNENKKIAELGERSTDIRSLLINKKRRIFQRVVIGKGVFARFQPVSKRVFTNFPTGKHSYFLNSFKVKQKKCI